MKIALIGDFHGKFPLRLKQEIQRQKVDLIISIGDYLPFFYRELWFKHCYRKEVDLDEIIGKKKYQKLIKEDIRRGSLVFKKLDDLGIPVFSVLGNVDYPFPDDVLDEKKIKKKMYIKYLDFIKTLKKYSNIKRIDYSYQKFNGFVFIGMRGHSFPGIVKSKAFRKHKRLLERLFRKFRKENEQGRVIFVSHNIPYNTKLDKVVSKNANKKVIGKHLGSKLARRIVEQQKPLLAVGGHIHEGFGQDKIGKTIILNSGSLAEGKMIFIDLEEKGKIRKIKFIGKKKS